MRKIIEKKVKHIKEEIELKIYSQGSEEYHLDAKKKREEKLVWRLLLTAGKSIITKALHDMLDCDDYNGLILELSKKDNKRWLKYFDFASIMTVLWEE